ncbi:MAG: hypothetical protein ACYTFW_19890, partial [Planctomycetota bacterium]
EAQIGSSLKTQRICRRFSPKEHLCRLRDTKTLSYFNELCEKESVTSEDERGQQLRNLPARHRSIRCFSSSLRSL